MRTRTTIRLLFVVILLACVIWFAEREIAPTRPGTLIAPVYKVNFRDVMSLEIDRPDFHVTCRKSQGTWHLIDPIEARANDGEVERILSALEGLVSTDAITPVERRKRGLSLRDYGVLVPRLRITLSGNMPGQELCVGNSTPVGDGMYVKLSANENILVVPMDMLGSMPEKIEILRDRIVVPGSAARTSRLEIQTPGHGFIQLTQISGRWSIQQPIAVRANSAKIVDMLDALYKLTVDRFVWDSTVVLRDGGVAADTKADPGVGSEPRHLDPDEATARITVFVDGDEVGKELLLGKSTDKDETKIYAKLRGGSSIYAVDVAILDVFSVNVTDLRDRYLFSLVPADIRYVAFQRGDMKLALKRTDKQGWMIHEPVQWRADDQTVRSMLSRVTRLTAESFVEAKSVDLAKLGLAPADYMVQLGSVAPSNGVHIGGGMTLSHGEGGSASSELLRLDVGGNMKNAANVFVKFHGRDWVYEVDSKAIASLGPDVVDPLVYHDRTMLSLTPKSVRRIVLRKGQTEQAIERNESDEWVVVADAEASVDMKTLDDVLFFVANMRATRIESLNVKKLGKYGLAKPQASLTLRLSGADGIQKTVLIGSAAGSSGVYATVQGQDVVFVLGDSFVRRLTSDLVLKHK